MKKPLNFNPLPAPGDIVWCYFPEHSSNPLPKPRPALVIAVAPEEHAVRVAYGTSQKTDRIYPGEFVLDPEDSGFVESGLSHRTKFDMGRSVKLPFNSQWFSPAPGFVSHTPLPKLGVLHPSYMKAAKAAY